MAIRPEVTKLREQVARLELVQEINLQFSSTLDFDQLLKTIFEKVIDTLKAEAGSFWIHESKSSEVVCHHAHGETRDKVMGLRLPVGEGIVGWCVENMESTVVLDAQKDERFSKVADSSSSFVTKSMICVPLVVGEECLGAIQVINKKGKIGSKFDEEDKSVIEALCVSGAIAIKNARLMQSEKKVKELKAMLEISQEITSTLDMDRVLYSIVNLTSQVIDYDRAVLALSEENDETKVELTAESGKEKMETGSPINLALKAFLESLSGEKELYIENKAQYLAKKPEAAEPVKQYLGETQAQSLYFKVLEDSEGRLGVLFLEARQPGFIQKDQMGILSILVNQATVAVRNASLYKNVPSFSSSGFGKGFKSGKGILAGVIALFLLLSFFIPAQRKAGCEVEVGARERAVVYSRQGDILEDITVEEGEQVKKGQLLARLRSRDVEMQLEKTQNDLSDVERQWAEASNRGDDALASSLMMEMSRLRRKADNLRNDLAERELRAPIDGIVVTPGLKDLKGTRVSAGDTVMEINRGAGSVLKAFVGEEDVIYVQPGDEIRYMLKAYPSRRDFMAKVLGVSAAPVDRNGVMMYQIEAENMSGDLQGLRFGMTGSGKTVTQFDDSLFGIWFAPWLSRLYNLVFF